MIYFDRQTQERLINRYYELLRPGGHLFIGHSESLASVNHPFSYCQPAVYKRDSGVHGDPLPHRQTVRIADMAISSDPRAELITHALGSCIGVSAYDPVRQIGGLIHIMLPLSKNSPDTARNNPLKYVDTGIPLFFKELFKAGAQRDTLEIKRVEPC